MDASSNRALPGERISRTAAFAGAFGGCVWSRDTFCMLARDLVSSTDHGRSTKYWRGSGGTGGDARRVIQQPAASELAFPAKKTYNPLEN